MFSLILVESGLLTHLWGEGRQKLNHSLLDSIMLEREGGLDSEGIHEGEWGGGS